MEGRTTAEIATSLGVEVTTLRTHVQHLLSKLARTHGSNSLRLRYGHGPSSAGPYPTTNSRNRRRGFPHDGGSRIGRARGETTGVDEPTAVLIVEDHPILSEALSVRMERRAT